MLRKISHCVLPAILILIGCALLGHNAQAQSYSLPNSNSGCPSNCRLITWQAGSDLWNAGTLPNYTSVTCSGLAANGTTNDGPAIQTCINNAASGTAVFLPAGTYLVNSTVRLKSSTVLRGAGPTTQINLGSSGQLTSQNFSSTNLTPSVSYGCNPSSSCVPYRLSGSPQKGDTTVTVSSGSVSSGQWILITSDDDPTLVTATGTDGFCQWCGANNGFQTMNQIVQVTGVSGSTLTLSRPLYYKLYTNPSYRIIAFQTQKAGYESFHVTATGDIGATPIILLQGCLYCWVKGVETQNTGSSSGSAHVEMDYSYGNEIRDGYYHDQRSGASGSGYGVYFQFVNSDHKVENNVMRHNRHAMVFQGGGSGVAVLYNYMDDGYTDDLSYLASARTSHGAHPYMNLFEGNVISHIAADDFWGTSSHVVFFRNWIWGAETGTGVPSFPPNNGYAIVDLYQGQEYYSYVGNAFGKQNLLAALSAATLTGFDEYASPTTPIVYSYGGALGSSASSAATILRHGNWDYKSNGVAFWDGGSNHTLASSMYYTAKPGFLSTYPWPLEGPEGNPTTNANAAETCYLQGPATGANFNPATCYSSTTTPPPTKPPAPFSLNGIVN
jgi:hypothetical protein